MHMLRLISEDCSSTLYAPNLSIVRELYGIMRSMELYGTSVCARWRVESGGGSGGGRDDQRRSFKAG